MDGEKKNLQDKPCSGLLATTSSELVNEEEGVAIKNKLKYMQEGDRWEQVEQLWRNSVNFRRNMLLTNVDTHVSNFIDLEWPSYKHSLGYTLVSGIAFLTFYLQNNMNWTAIRLK